MLSPFDSIFRAKLTLGALLCLSLGTGCTDDDADGGGVIQLECGGHGHLHDDHCHCNPGYMTSADGSGCVPQEMRMPDPEPEASEDMGVDMDPDAGSDTDGDVEESGDETPPLDFEPETTRAFLGTADDDTRIWSIEAMQGGTRLRVEFYEGFGAPTSPGVVDITANETNYATCSTCLILETGCVEHGDHFDCQRRFMPRAEGQVRLDAIGGIGDQLTGECLGIHFQEVTIGQGFQTEPVPDGMAFGLDAWTFDATLEAFGGGEPEAECGGHGQLHGDHCHCDPGYRLDPQNPRNCIPQ